MFVLFSVLLLAQSTPVLTGREVPQLSAYDAALRPVFEKWKVPGAAVAITDNGRLVYARGFGFADRDAGIPVQPTSLFRLASISKTLASMTALTLVDEGKLNLDAKFLDLIPHLPQASNPAPDPRMASVSVRQLLQHVAGFDRDLADDHVIFYNTASRLFNAPVTKDLMTRYAISQRLDVNPGTKYAYGNTTHQIVGRIIERIVGKPFEDVLREKILLPSGATSIRQGRGLLENRHPDEVKYYDYPGAPLTTTPVVPGAPRPTPRQYGNNWLEMGDSYGGMIGNAIDLMKYINALEGRRGTALLRPASLATIVQRPAAPVTQTGAYTGLTWRITPVTGGQHWWHSGGAAGTRNLLARRQNNRDWVILTNTRPEDEDSIIQDMFDAMSAAEARVTAWPTHDLFTEFTGSAISTGTELLAFQSSGGAAPAAQNLQVTLSPAASATIDPVMAQVNGLPVATPASHWLRIDRRTGTFASAAVSVSVDPRGLESGQYEALVRVSTPNAVNGSHYVRVVLNVVNAATFTSIRNGASLSAAVAAAPGSRLIVEAAEDLKAESILAGGISVQTVGAVSARRVDFVLPSETAVGSDIELTATTASGRTVRAKMPVEPVSPGLYSAARDGKGAALAMFWRGESEPQPAYLCGETCETTQIDLGESEEDSVSLQLAATGIRGQSDLTVQIGGETVEVVAVTPSESEPGVDLLTVRLPRALIGQGELEVAVTSAEKSSNAVKIRIK